MVHVRVHKAGWARIDHKGMHVPAGKHSFHMYMCLSLQKPHPSRHSGNTQGLGMNDNTWVEQDLGPADWKISRPHHPITLGSHVCHMSPWQQDCSAPQLPI
jgi:hypothetical protein